MTHRPPFSTIKQTINSSISSQLKGEGGFFDFEFSQEKPSGKIEYRFLKAFSSSMGSMKNCKAK